MLKGTIWERVAASVLIAALCFGMCAAGFAFAEYATEPQKTTSGAITEHEYVLPGTEKFIPKPMTKEEINQQTLEVIKRLGIRTIQIEHMEIPFHSGDIGNTWAFVNPVLTILGVLGALLAIIHCILTRRRRRNQYNLLAFKAESDDLKIYRTDSETQQQELFTRKLPYAILAAAAATVNVIFAFVFEDPRRLMVLTDRFTLPTSILFAAEIVLIVIAVTRGKGAKD